MSKKYSDRVMAIEILKLIGGAENVATHTNCMTRLRVTAKDDEVVDADALTELPYVIRYQFVAGVHQIVIGPGTVNRVRAEFDKLVGIGEPGVEDDKHETVEEKSMGQRFTSMMQATMMPSIGALIGVALITALINILGYMGITPDTNAFVNALKVFATFGGTAIGVYASFNLAKYLGGNPYLAMLFGMFIISEVSITQVSVFGTELTSGIGGIVGMLFTAAALSYIQRGITKFIPDSLNLVLVPFLTAIITLAISLYIIIPIAGVITMGLLAAFNFILNGSPIVYVLGCVLLAATYPLLVMSGLHMALFIVVMPIFFETGQMPLIAAAFLGGAAQLGTATGVFVKEKDKDPQIKEIYIAGAPAAVLGIIEPLMYGINVPKAKPLMLALVAAGIGGLAIGLSGMQMGYALAGLIGALSFETVPQMVLYAAIWIGTAAVGFALTTVFYKSKK